MDQYYCDAKLAEVSVNIFGTSGNILKMEGETNQRAMEISNGWDSNVSFQKCALLREDTFQHFQRNIALNDYFPLTADLLTKEKGLQPFQGLNLRGHSGTIRRMVKRPSAPYGFISSAELGDVYFNQQSFAAENEWDRIEQGIQVEFDIIATSKPYKPRAINLRISINQ